MAHAVTVLIALVALIALNNQRQRDRQPKVIEVKFSWAPPVMPTTDYLEIESMLKTQLDEARKEEERRYFDE
jgi:hypothetical protein